MMFCFVSRIRLLVLASHNSILVLQWIYGCFVVAVKIIMLFNVILETKTVSSHYLLFYYVSRLNYSIPRNTFRTNSCLLSHNKF